MLYVCVNSIPCDACICAVRGYLPSSRNSEGNVKQVSEDQESLAKLSLLKQSLLLELKNFESNEKVVATQLMTPHVQQHFPYS